MSELDDDEVLVAVASLLFALFAPFWAVAAVFLSLFSEKSGRE